MRFAFLASVGIVCLAACGGAEGGDRNHPNETPSSGGNIGANAAAGSSGAGGSATTMSDGGGGMMVPTPGTLRGAGNLIGTALSSNRLDDSTYSSIAGTEFSYVTPENEMKWDATEFMQGRFQYAAGDRIVEFAETHGMKVKGHTLVWHKQLPGWMQSMTGANGVLDAMNNHITQVMTHFKDHVAAWDVVNEAVDGAALRQNVFLQQIGSTYIAEAFRTAHAADDGALLFYNDFGAEGSGPKSNAVFTLVKGLVDAGVPIHGVGLQMHIGLTGAPSAAEVAANIKRYVDLGLKVSISEMDVSLCRAMGGQDAAFAAQQTRYRDIMKACLDSAGCHSVTVWGISDKNSWLNTGMPCMTQGQSHWPLAFDDNYQKKPAYTGILNALLGT